MERDLSRNLISGLVFALVATASLAPIAGADTVHPARMSSVDQTGKIFENPATVVTIPKEWTGVWETDGYRRIRVIYSGDGSALE